MNKSGLFKPLVTDTMLLNRSKAAAGPGADATLLNKSKAAAGPGADATLLNKSKAAAGPGADATLLNRSKAAANSREYRKGDSFDTGTGEGKNTRFEAVKTAIQSGRIKPTTRAIKENFGTCFDVAKNFLSEMASQGVIVAGERGRYSLKI
ncbi:MAG: hypothetical protein GY862_37670 [Gammaproteobacteria bacterium]|nr:hypothetical protein [Gammaproteobacteria bacterium]